MYHQQHMMMRLPSAIMLRSSLQRVSSLERHRWFSTKTGYVKFFNRQKAYGFIHADGDEGEVFVHRKSIAGATDASTYLPFLLQNERVQFKLVQENGKSYAKDVKFEDGRLVPHFRQKHVENLKESVKRRMGMEIFAILDSKTMDEGTKVSSVMMEFETAKERIGELDSLAAKEGAVLQQGHEQEPEQQPEEQEEDKLDEEQSEEQEEEKLDEDQPEEQEEAKQDEEQPEEQDEDKLDEEQPEEVEEAKHDEEQPEEVEEEKHDEEQPEEVEEEKHDEEQPEEVEDKEQPEEQQEKKDSGTPWTL